MRAKKRRYSVYLFKYLIKYKPKDNQQRTKDIIHYNDNKERLAKD